MASSIEQVYDSIVAGDMAGTAARVQAAVDAGLPAEVILKQGLVSAMTEVGRRFEEGDYFVPEMLISARAMQSGLAILKPLLIDSAVQATGRVVIGTVKGDLHDIGKNLVAMMCEGAGFEVKDLGKDVEPDAFVEAVKEFEPDVLGMSALLTTTMRTMEHTVKALEEAGVRDKVKIMIGGAPVTQAFSDQIGADGYASNAASAADLAKKFVS
jgi:5-methyltetrahydrofolate--homocysteine methyltransferase